MGRQGRSSAGSGAGERVTIVTIARELGVHPSTVSRALSGASRVSGKRAAQIRAAALALGYKPNPWARSLRTHRSHLIGLVVPRLTDGVLAHMFEAAEDRARSAGYQAVTSSTRDVDEEERRLVRALTDRRVDGLILATALLDDPLLDELAAQGVPFVLLNRRSGDHPVVRGNDALGGYLAVRHLISAGHRRIGFISGPKGVSTAVDRREGYERALTEGGLALDPALVVESTFSAEGGVRAASDLLSREDRPTAIFAVNDATAVGAMAVARDLGLEVPDDLALVGYNDTELAALLPVGLSSVSVSVKQMGEIAVDLLLEQLGGSPRRSVLIAPQLVVRASSAKPVRSP
jgi:LacI family transcriptional regulator